jgi:predicted DNA-binding protein (MmcQ/YjbR family)
VPTEPGHLWMSLKCSDEEFAELIERPGIIPAPYLARAKWVALESEDARPCAAVERLLRNARDLVFAKLPRKLQTQRPLG